MEENWEFKDVSEKDIKILKVTEFSDTDLEERFSLGYYFCKSYRVTLIDDGYFTYSSNNIQNSNAAYTEALKNFYRSKMVEGFIFELCQPIELQKDKIRIINYSYEYESDFWGLLMMQYHDYSFLLMGHNKAFISYKGRAITLDKMLSKIHPNSFIPDKALDLMELMLNSTGHIILESCIKVSDVYTTSDFMMAYETFEKLMKCFNAVDITDIKSIDINWKAIEVEAEERSDEEYEKINKELENWFQEIVEHWKNREYTDEDDDWDSSIEGTSDDTNPPTKPSKSTKPKSNKSKAKSSKKKESK
jgi:hypothetical protein